ncbi:L-seryl-tRNA(Sec) selenium transferase [Halocella sp. SP3-1]|uniref:L-seryl-tRNA(Sec) selenium transferase n=1 Tax=Halocella sp. SP3-1 TaxID=2382161 RepID=UPI000F75A5E3|nr:L-seryl-tRNA(Sec) selenium transferase [Halocella sp. SP3-1]AZO94721.1 L-seryl-tRNA(Sec) selenium transferase [Halocella sp. SP3-1]
MKEKQEYLRKIPAVNDLLATELVNELVDRYSHELVVAGIREVIDNLRERILEADLEKLQNEEIEIEIEQLLKQVKQFLINKSSSSLMPVINATGVIIHTNLGRSLLSKSAQKAVQRISSHYSTLEIDRESGKRGSRYSHVRDILTELTGAEDALVVNNNAAAVLLALSALAADKEVVIARGQLVEIGGSFRIPEVMEQSGAKLVEVGSTNKVYLKDYERAITEETGLLLKVHTSNYRVMGFTKEVELEDLSKLGAKYELPVVEDLGSGILVDSTLWGLSYEPTVQDSIGQGADVVTFSGDKMLGGPQAGIIVGNKKYLDKMKRHPLNRVVRVDKFTLAALEATLKEYRNSKRAYQEIPTLRMLNIPEDELKEKAATLMQNIREVISSDFNLAIRKDSSQIGGGAFPLEKLPTYVVELSHNNTGAEKIAEKLRLNTPPIFTRIYSNALLFDLRTIQDNELPELVAALKNITYGN